MASETFFLFKEKGPDIEIFKIFNFKILGGSILLLNCFWVVVSNMLYF